MLYIIFYLISQVLLSFCDKASSNAVTNMRKAVKYGYIRGFFGALCAFLLVVFSGSGFKINILSVLCALAFGLCIAVDLINYLFLAKTGMVTLMTLTNQAASLILPTLAGLLLFNNPVKPIQWIFIALLLVAAYMLCDSSKNIYSGFSYKTVGMLIIRFLAGGFGTLSMQAFAKVGDGNTNLFLTIAYVVSSVIMLAVYPFIKTEKSRCNNRLSKKLIILSFAASILFFAANAFTVMAARILEPIIQFSIATIGAMVLNLLMGAICFKEKITVKSSIAIVMASISVVMINYFN